MATEVLQITLPTEIAELLHDRVRSGEYATESDVIIDLFHQEDDLDLSLKEMGEAARLGYEALQQLRAHPETVVTHEQMWAEFDKQRASRRSVAA